MCSTANVWGGRVVGRVFRMVCRQGLHGMHYLVL
jgi:hypothetical protein